MHAGKDGGTAVVIKSKNFSTISLFVSSASTIKNLSEMPKPITHNILMKIIYLRLSLEKVSSSGLGKSIALIKFPLNVLNPV